MKKLGRITHVEYGFGGYDDAAFGLTLTFEADGGCSTFFHGMWAHEPMSYAKWTVEDQMNKFAETAALVRDTLRKAKKKHVAQLVGVPVEIEWENGIGPLKSWRVLEEVL